MPGCLGSVRTNKDHEHGQMANRAQMECWVNGEEQRVRYLFLQASDLKLLQLNLHVIGKLLEKDSQGMNIF